MQPSVAAVWADTEGCIYDLKMSFAPIGECGTGFKEFGQLDCESRDDLLAIEHVVLTQVLDGPTGSLHARCLSFRVDPPEERHG